jgi:hypothetical protein
VARREADSFAALRNDKLTPSQVERVVAVDWSGDRSAAGQRRKIWAGVWTDGPGGGTVRLESGRTREELCDWLIELARETPQMVVGIDCCFSYPAWFLAEHGCATVFDFWRAVASGKGEEWLHRECADGRFWGRVGPLRSGKKPEEFCGPAGSLRMLRRADEACKVRARIIDPEQAAKVKGIAPKSPFQIGGAGAVGTGTLRGIPRLKQLHEAGFRVWPFEGASFGEKNPKALLVEIYPRLLTGAVNKGNVTARAEYLVKKQANHPGYRNLDAEVMAKAGMSEDAFDALVSVLAMAEFRQNFLTLQKTEDPITSLEGAVWGAGELALCFINPRGRV